MNYYDDEHVERIIMRDIGGYYTYIYRRLSDILHQENGAWAIQHPKVVYEDPLSPNTGDIRSMTCFTDRVKVTKVIGTNPTRVKNPAISVGTVVQMDMAENRPICLYDATALSSIRTAAMAAVGMDVNFPELSPDRVLIVGRGMVGKYLERFLHILWPMMDVNTWDIKDGALLHYNGYDVVFTATNSKEPFLYDNNCDASLVVSVGADTHFQRELGKSLILTRRNVYVDAGDAYEIGDLEQFIDKNVVRGSLWLMLEKCDADCFISAGTALMDALTVEYLYEHS